MSRVNTGTSGSKTGRFGYGTPYGYQEDEGGLKQLGHRLYDPLCGRFVTKDAIKDGRNWYAYCDNNPLLRSDPTGNGWHDPGIVYVDPGFKGTVIVVGEDQGCGDDQVTYEILPGQHSNPHVDVDLIIVIMPDGSIIVYAFWGWEPPWGLDHPQLVIVQSDGSVTGPNIHRGNSVSEFFGANTNAHLTGKRGKYPPRNGYPNMRKYLAGLNPGSGKFDPSPPMRVPTPITGPPGTRPWHGFPMI